MLKSALARIKRIRDVVWKVLELSRERKGILIVFVVASVFNALTEGFTVMLVVPLLDTLSSDSLFRGVPILGSFSDLFQHMDVIERLRWVSLIIFVIVIMRGLVLYFVDIVIYVIPSAIDTSLRARAIKAIFRAQMSFVDGLSIGRLSNLASGFPIRVGVGARFLAQMASSLITAMLLFALLVTITPKALIGLVVFTLIASMIFRRLTGAVTISVSRELTAAYEGYNQVFAEALANHKTVRIFNAQTFVRTVLEGMIKRLQQVQLKQLALQAATYPFFSTVGGLFVCAVMFGATLFSQERAQGLLGVVVVFLVGLSRLLGPLSIFHIARMAFVTNVTAVEELYDFLKQAEGAIDKDGAHKLDRLRGEVVFDKVSFDYNAETRLLGEIDMRIAPGEMTAIVGPSGAGKTTLLRLLTRIYRPQSGSIRIDGVDLNDVAIASFWGNIGYVSQDVPIFRASVRDNIAFGKTERVDEAALRRAADMADATRFIENLPDGFDTVLSEGGSSLSGGERQRIALARAFLHEAQLIILDEATSQLDAFTQETVQISIEALRRSGRTLVVIAHRLSTVQRADKIFVLDKGALVESGTHAELLHRRGMYAEMVERQMIVA